MSSELTLSMMCNFQSPTGSSPQKWTVMNRQSLKPASDLSLGRAVSSWLIVPAS